MGPPPPPCRPITAEEQSAFHRDGVVCLRGLFDGAWVDRLRELVDEQIAAPSDQTKPIDAPGASGFFFFDAYLCHHHEGWRRAALEGPGAEAAARVMGSSQSTLIFVRSPLFPLPHLRPQAGESQPLLPRRTSCWSRSRVHQPKRSGIT